MSRSKCPIMFDDIIINDIFAMVSPGGSLVDCRDMAALIRRNEL